MAGKLVVFSGAGLSAESGIPTFRDKQGLWENHDVNEVCNFVTWKQNFDKVHSFYDRLRTNLTTVEPNPVHKNIIDLKNKIEVVNITTNVDDLLERAGDTDTYHLHGNLTTMHCTACSTKWNIGYRNWNNERCPKCSSLKGVKPGVTFFNETAEVEYRHLHKVIGSLRQEDVALVIGSSCLVIPFHFYLSNKSCLKIINSINIEDEVKEQFDHVFDEKASSAIDGIAEIVLNYLNK